jgi:membrane protein YqaA with SNARE-associated domain
VLSLVAVGALAFAAATFLPVPSEGAVLSAWHAGEALFPLWLVATLGNTAGSLAMYAVGLGVVRWPPLQARLAGPRQAYAAWLGRYGAPVLLLAWLPGVGDALAPLAGALGVSARAAALCLFLGKGARYAVVLGTAEALRAA